MDDSIILPTLFVLVMAGIACFFVTADADNKLAKICIKILRIISFPGLIMSGALFCFFACLATAPVLFSGPMNMNPFGTTEVSLWMGIPLLMPVLFFAMALRPFRRFTKWTLLFIGATTFLFTLINFLHFPISAYNDEMFDIYGQGGGYAPANLGCFVVSIIYAMMFIAGFVYLHLEGRSKHGNQAQAPSIRVED